MAGDGSARGNTRHRHRGAERADHRPQRPLDLRAARRARRRGGPHPGRRRSPATTSRPGCASWPSRACDLIVTSGGLGPDRRRPDRRGGRGASPGARWSSTRRWRSRSPRSSPASPAAGSFDPEALERANRKQAMVPEGADDARSGRHRAGPRGPGRGGPRRDRPARAAARAPARCGRPALATRAARGVLERSRRRSSGLRVRMFGIPESEIAKSAAGDRGRRGRPLARSRSPPACGAGEIEIDVRHRRAAPSASARCCVEGLDEPPRGASSSAPTARRSTSSVAALLEGRTLAPRRVLHRRPARGADHRAPGSVRLLRRRRRLLLERGEDAICSGSSRR